ncbi:MAG TPA: YdeI/OmpD-associated family protein [Solirubrobacteraceae bacterium]|nr:YdeI/OmpD-associated family protein [Solirubrobacteraceae bacterium]
MPSVGFVEAIEVALCFGWIDGKRQRGEEEGWFRQRFTPRRARSKWSQINRERAEALIAAGRMRPAGLAEVERAKADDRWENAYPPPSRIQAPGDLRAALDASPAAAEAFAGLTASQRYSVLYRVHDARRPETRARRIATFVAMLERGERP